MLKTLRHNIVQNFLALDQLANAFLCMVFIPKEKCWAEESMSAHAHRMRINGQRSWPEKVINTLFCWDREGDKRHCELAFESELLQRHLPPELRR